jgi:hypothetical protein
VDAIKDSLSNEEQKVGAEIVKKALTYPLKLIANNAGVNGSVVMQRVVDSRDPNYGYNAATGQYEDLMASGIIDPTKVRGEGGARGVCFGGGVRGACGGWGGSKCVWVWVCEGGGGVVRDVCGRVLAGRWRADMWGRGARVPSSTTQSHSCTPLPAYRGNKQLNAAKPSSIHGLAFVHSEGFQRDI